jgi:hypothetical protein
VVWCGVVWCGVVWCGVVWCGVVWCGVVYVHTGGAYCGDNNKGANSLGPPLLAARLPFQRPSWQWTTRCWPHCPRIQPVRERWQRPRHKLWPDCWHLPWPAPHILAHLARWPASGGRSGKGGSAGGSGTPPGCRFVACTALCLDVQCSTQVRRRKPG